MTSPDLTEVHIDKVAELFPSVITETLDTDGNPKKAIDFDLLRQELSDHVVEGPQERYQLDWPGKREAAFAANAPIAKTLRPIRGNSVNFDTTKNLFIEGDNLEALKLLQESYLGKVKLIYIDPPYNTGGDFIYDDDFAESVGDYLERSGQADAQGAKLVANTESNGRFHSDWLSMMYPRLKLARNLLKDDGVIFISIDDNEIDNLRKLCAEVFGAQNFVAQIIWQKRTSPEARKRLGAGHEYIVVYVRDARNIESALLPLPLDDKDRAAFSNPDADPRGPWVSSDFTAPGYRPNQMYEIVTPSGLKVVPPPGRCWMNVEAEYKAQVAEGRFWYGPDGKGIPRRKTYLEERDGKSAWTWWPNSEVGHTQEGTREVRALFDKDGPTFFDFPKPVRLMRRIVQLATRPEGGDVVLDFFAGSGTLAHAVMAQNSQDGGDRRFIMVQIDEVPDPKSDAAKAGYTSIADISRSRIGLAAALICEEARLTADALDGGFRTLKLDTTNMTDVLRTPEETGQQTLTELDNSVKPGRSAEDLLFQVLLDWGLELTMPIVSEELEGHEVFVVEDDALIACFDPEVSPELVRAIAKRAPTRAVFRDSSFASDAARINAEQIFRELSPSLTDVKVI
ncbi:site-specific DNA-methyltransferase [Mycolicibacterium fortuitum]|uniref:site-specific DNA-methyltransferase n=1 Tax=Mycolicibacterium fortuitum TaxID=1766 RepID=UPI000A52D9AE|nr:site-specific DNA-methyltransferase [Mycolicibacterium fortuitum]